MLAKNALFGAIAITNLMINIAYEEEHNIHLDRSQDFARFQDEETLLYGITLLAPHVMEMLINEGNDKEELIQKIIGSEHVTVKGIEHLFHLKSESNKYSAEAKIVFQGANQDSEQRENLISSMLSAIFTIFPRQDVPHTERMIQLQTIVLAEMMEQGVFNQEKQQ